MASDTGAPWNLPYPESTDLVRDGATDIEALADAVALGLTAANVGIGSNVVQTVKTDAFSTTSSSYTDITGLAVTITPSSASSKIAVFFTVVLSQSGVGSGVTLRLVRASTDIFVNTDAAIAIERSTATAIVSGTANLFSNSGVFVDTPETSSPVTYKLTMRVTGNTGFVNRRGDSTNSGTVSHITAVEVAA
jgi:hypothetical protein